MLFVTVHLSLLGIAACGSDDPCDIQSIESAGKVRGGFTTEGEPLGPIGVDGKTVTCLVCQEVYTLDDHMKVISSAPAFKPPLIDADTQNHLIAAAPDGTVYVVHRRELADGSADFDLTAYAAAGDQLWQIKFPGKKIAFSLKATADGPIVIFDAELSALAAKDGSVRWTAPSLDDVSVAATGELVGSANEELDNGASKATFSFLESASGQARWTKPITGFFGGFTISTVTDHGLIIAGSFRQPLDFGDVQLTPKSHDNFVAVLDNQTGATRFAVDLGEQTNFTIALVNAAAPVGNDVLLAGELLGPNNDQRGAAFGFPVESGEYGGFLVRAGANGIVTADKLSANVESLAVGTDNVAFITATYPTNPFVIAGQTLPSASGYAVAFDL